MQTNTIINSSEIHERMKEIVKQQLKCWSLKEVEQLTYQINEVEHLIKKHNSNSIFILFNFIIKTEIKYSI